MSDAESRFQQLVARLKGSDYRLTPQRVALLRLIASSEGHPSESNLYEQSSPNSHDHPRPLQDLNSEGVGQVLSLAYHEDNRTTAAGLIPPGTLICVRCEDHGSGEPVDDLAQEVEELTG